MSPATRHTVAVVFDLDGTLVDSEPSWAAGFSTGLSAILAERGHGSFHLDAAQMGQFRGGRVPDTVRDIVGWLGLADSVRGGELERVTELVIESVTASFAAHPRPIPEAVETAKTLAEHGVRMAVASSSALGFIEAALRVLDLVDAFPVRVSAVGLEHGKPHPEVYQRALAAVGVPARRALAIEDSPVGVGAAVNAGMACVWFVPAADATVPAPDLAGLAGFIEPRHEASLATTVTTTRHLRASLVQGILDDLADKGATR